MTYWFVSLRFVKLGPVGGLTHGMADCAIISFGSFISKEDIANFLKDKRVTYKHFNINFIMQLTKDQYEYYTGEK